MVGVLDANTSAILYNKVERDQNSSFKVCPLVRWPDSANLKSKFKNDESKSQTVNPNDESKI